MDFKLFSERLLRTTPKIPVVARNTPTTGLHLKANVANKSIINTLLSTKLIKGSLSNSNVKKL